MLLPINDRFHEMKQTPASKTPNTTHLLLLDMSAAEYNESECFKVKALECDFNYYFRLTANS